MDFLINFQVFVTIINCFNGVVNIILSKDINLGLQEDNQKLSFQSPKNGRNISSKNSRHDMGIFVTKFFEPKLHQIVSFFIATL